MRTLLQRVDDPVLPNVGFYSFDSVRSAADDPAWLKPWEGILDVGGSIVTALVAAASVGASGVVEKAFTDAYHALKLLLRGRLSTLDRLLEKPGSEAVQASAKEEIAEKQIENDEAVVAQAHSVIEIVQALPGDRLPKTVSLERVRAAGDILIRHNRGPTQLHDVEATDGKIVVEHNLPN